MNTNRENYHIIVIIIISITVIHILLFTIKMKLWLVILPQFFGT